MIYYIKQKWFQSAQVCVLLILEWGLQAAASLLMIQTFDAIFRLECARFLFWTGINLVTWGLYVCHVLSARDCPSSDDPDSEQ